MTTAHQSFWTEGDLCIYEAPQTEQFFLGCIKKIDPETKLCTIHSPLVNADPLVKTENLSTPTVQDKTRIVQSPLNKTTILMSDEDFFSRKLHKIVGLAPELVPKTATMPHSRTRSKTRTWAPGDLCICMWSEDGSYYYASITEADANRDRYLVTYCYYENQETKRAVDLHELGTDFEMLVEDDQNKACVLNRKVLGMVEPCKQGGDMEQAEEKFASVLNLTKTREKSRLPSHDPVTSKPPAPSLQPNPSKSPGERLAADIMTNVNLDSLPHLVFSGDHSSPMQAAQSAISNLARLNHVDQFHSTSDSAWQALLISWFMCGYHTGYYEALRKPKQK